jgi:hypothetical protein
LVIGYDRIYGRNEGLHQATLLYENRMHVLLDQVGHSEGTGLALFLVMQAVPCILHYEDHLCKKILSMIISEGISNAEVGNILRKSSTMSKKVCMEAYIKQLENIINMEILGDEYNPTQWNVQQKMMGKFLEVLHWTTTKLA